MAHERNIAESVAILALAYRAGLANRDGDVFSVEPASEVADRQSGFDLIIRRNGRMLFVDITNSRAFKRLKITRTVEFARDGRRWVYILKVDWDLAWPLAVDPCFRSSFARLQDGQPVALDQACPVHGNRCELAQKLLDFSNTLNNILAFSKTEARDFAMEID